MNTPKTRLALLGIAAGILLALLVAPQTRWLVRLQALTVLHQYRPIGCESYSRSPAGDARAYDTAAARHPNDFAVQYAQAALDGNASPAANLRALTQRFPNSPALYANLLREESRRPLLSSAAGSKLSGDPPPSGSMPASPQEIAACNQDAEAGERADPDNSYFPLMLAYGLFAAHRDADALAAIKRASVKPVWNEYLTENVEAKWRLHTEAFGDPGALPQTAVWSSEVLPEYQRLRQAARIVVYQAMLKEQAGRKEEGYQLREAIRRCGDIMRVQSTTLIGSLVGVAITAIAEARPGGAPALRQGTGEEPEQIAQQRLNAYCAYVTKIGHPEAAQKARDEETARRTVQGTMKDDPEMLRVLGPLQQLIVWWMAGVGLLLNIAWLLVLRIAAAGGSCLAAKPGLLPSAAQLVRAFGLWLLLFLFGMLAVGFLSFDASDPRGLVWSAGLGLVGTAGLATWYVIRGLCRLPPSQRRAVLKIAALLPVFGGVIYGVLCLTQWVAWPLAEIPQGLKLLLYSGDSDTETLQTQTLWFCAAAALAVPLLLTVTLGVAAGVKRMPLFSALTTGFQQFALPLICLLVVAYGGVLFGTVRQEQRVAAFNQQIVTNSGRYFAAQAGQDWPGAVK